MLGMTDRDKIAGYGITEWIHEDSWPTREYYELCYACASPLQRANATARLTVGKAETHKTICALCGRYLARIPSVEFGGYTGPLRS